MKKTLDSLHDEDVFQVEDLVHLRKVNGLDRVLKPVTASKDRGARCARGPQIRRRGLAANNDAKAASARRCRGRVPAGLAECEHPRGRSADAPVLGGPTQS